jgi:hypothetical protein
MDDNDSSENRGLRPRRSPLLRVLGAGMALAGFIWIFQGLGILTAGGSFMVGDSKWAVIGAIFVVAGALVAQRARR